jgi:hypothetical protein
MGLRKCEVDTCVTPTFIIDLFTSTAADFTVAGATNFRLFLVFAVEDALTGSYFARVVYLITSFFFGALQSIPL